MYMYLALWLSILALFSMQMRETMRREAYYQSVDEFPIPDPHPVRSWLAVFAIFGSSWALTGLFLTWLLHRAQPYLPGWLG